MANLQQFQDRIACWLPLAIVTQQNGGAPLSMMPQDNAKLEIDPDPRLERDADQAIQDLQFRIANHLICQVMDCYLLMRIAPPEPLRIRGLGSKEAIGIYNGYDIYDLYWDPDEEISTWFEEHTPENAYEHHGGSLESVT